MRCAVTVEAAAAVLALTVAACGGTSAPKDVTGAPTLQSAAASLGCTGLEPMSQPTMFASAEGNCEWQGRSVDLATFASDTLKTNWLKIATQFSPLIKDGPGGVDAVAG
jgi:hypothetical protein